MSADQIQSKRTGQITNAITLNIMLISEDDAQISDIKETLNELMFVPWDMIHCENLKDVKPRINKADIIVLDAGNRGPDYAKRLFEVVKGLQDEAPIIVVTGESLSARELAVYVMEKGASDILIRGAFGRLVDAIEYAIIRQTIITREKKKGERTLSNIESTEAAKMHAMEDAVKSEQHRQEQLLDMFLGGYSVKH